MGTPPTPPTPPPALQPTPAQSDTSYTLTCEEPDITIIPAIPQAQSVKQAKAATQDAIDAQAAAAAQSREVARSLRASGLSIDDTAWIMGVSRSRVSQLARA